jgi:hypothetical protein
MPDERMWFQDPAGFLAGDRVARFLPQSDTSTPEQLNALLRGAVYFTLCAFLFRRNSLLLLVPLVVAALTYLIYTASRAPPGFSFEEKSRRPRPSSSRKAPAAAPLHPADREGYREGGGALRDGGGAARGCSAPTLDNPFMNVLLTDYADRPDREPACDLGLPRVDRRAQRYFDHNLYRDVDDVFGRNASSHQFYAMPNTQVPNDQTGFARWLYQTGPTCKERSERCDRFDMGVVGLG